MTNAQSIATMTKTLKSIDRCLNPIKEDGTVGRVTVHYDGTGLNDCIHCGEKDVEMHCSKCWAPICYDCAKNSIDNEPICRECKAKEV